MSLSLKDFMLENGELKRRTKSSDPHLPEHIEGGFYCSNNQLTSLEGAPESVGGYFNCSNNQLTSLEGAPESVGGHFDCRNNQLTSLEGAPESVGGSFYCSNNKVEEAELLRFWEEEQRILSKDW